MVANITGRKYAPYAYEGAPDAEHVVVIMGSGAVTGEIRLHPHLDFYLSRSLVPFRCMVHVCLCACVCLHRIRGNSYGKQTSGIYLPLHSLTRWMFVDVGLQFPRRSST